MKPQVVELSCVGCGESIFGVGQMPLRPLCVYCEMKEYKEAHK